MNESIFEDKLNELVKEIGSIPPSQRKKFVLLAKKTHKAHKELKKSVSGLQDSLDYLRICIKYLCFDLEATKRENAYLKKLLDGKNK